MLRPQTKQALIILGAVFLLTSSGGAAHAADVDDFDYSSWDARYEISLDGEGRAVMNVTETLVAEFPEFDQNRGIVYGLATGYRGAQTGTEVLSVTDENGDEVEYETETDDGLLYVLTGNDDYVHGSQTYVIEYEMHDTMLAADNGFDEFYWNLLPLNSTQDIDQFRAEIMFSPELSEALTGNVRCYGGAAGESEPCTVDGPEQSSDGAVFRLDAASLAAGEGRTVAVGFEPGTVTQPFGRSEAAVPINASAIALSAAGAVTAIGSGFAMGAHLRKRRQATGIIVAQYDVPADLPPLLAAPLLKLSSAVIPAQMVHLAVRGALRIEEVPGKKAGKKRLQLRLRDASRMVGDELDQQALDAFFKKADGEGVTLIPKNSSGFAKRMERLEARGISAAESRGLVTRERARAAIVLEVIAIVLCLIGVGFLITTAVLGQSGHPGIVLPVIIGAGITFVLSFVAFAKHRVLTPEGAERYEYLMGVREFIRVAEEDRLRMLQSYTGAERRTDGSVDVVHLYEKLLPYAMLFGQEKEWGIVLETHYDSAHSQPGWYHGSSPTAFAAQMALFSTSTQASSSYVAPSSSSSGGSIGGGFSGGGGGGGFSGGR